MATRIHEISQIASYLAVDQFQVKLSTFLLRILNLRPTDENSVGIAAVNLPSAMRLFLHVYCNVILPQCE